jgi:hypothetical protein
MNKINEIERKRKRLKQKRTYQYETPDSVMLDFLRVFTVGDLKLLIYATTVETRIVGDLGKLFRSFLSALCFLILFGKGNV